MENNFFYMTIGEAVGICKSLMRYCPTCDDYTAHSYLYTRNVGDLKSESHIYGCSCGASRSATPGDERQFESDLVRDALACWVVTF